MPLSTDQLERYSRQIQMQGWGEEGQERLSSARVFVAGVGGLGCAAAVYLATAGLGEIVCCDGDVVERSNLNRQFLYTRDDLTMPKAAVAAKRLAPLNPDIKVVPVMTEMDSRSLPGLIGGSDVVLDCLDNPETRVALNRACISDSIPMVHAAVSELTGHLTFLSPPETPCLECFVGEARPAADPAVPGVTAGVLGTLEAMEVVKFLTGIGETLSGRLLVMEGAEPRFDVVALERDPSCPACSVLG